MFEYHGWVTLRSTAAAVDPEPELDWAAIKRHVQEWGDYAVVDLRGHNGIPFAHMWGQPNHRLPDAIDFFAGLGRLAPGSYGLLHVWDDEHPEHRNEFRVHRMVRGQVTEHPEPLLSPCLPVLEDKWSWDDEGGAPEPGTPPSC
ncbi:hypothetical protein JOF53_003967 [Crossiella equi]|uniref:Immunity protein 7 of polymorphic toxin system n=1 Tax=Crossiella equi TaxID=130796 RepID=A0ABS5AET8_9PSEU|nr:Imm7 family immunity protein [Crossiella equi]MBP2475095.1 hypothetical protein [Crossiella equi]